MTKHISIRIHGEVQGVFFRATAKVQAQERGLLGFVRNENDGSVYIEAEGDERDLLAFLEWCRSGPPLANIEKIDYTLTDNISGFRTFEME